MSYTASSFCVFAETIRTAAKGPAKPIVEGAVLVHEVGHNLGLVNIGAAMVAPHEDASHPAHDANTSCVMHYAIATDLVTAVTGSLPDRFDAECIADLQAAGGK